MVTMKVIFCLFLKAMILSNKIKICEEKYLIFSKD